MTLAKIVQQKLSDTSADGQRHEFTAADEAGGWNLFLTAERRDQWTTEAWEMSLRRDVSSGNVATWAQAIAERSTGLLEPLGVVELDQAHDRALLRSAPPTERDGMILYYEVVLQGTTSALARRFEGTHASGKRDQIAFALTNEVLAKWIGDLTAE